MAKAMDLLLKYLALKDLNHLISSLFLSRILPYDTAIPSYPYPYRKVTNQGKEALRNSQVRRRSRVSLCRSLSVDLSLSLTHFCVAGRCDRCLNASQRGRSPLCRTSPPNNNTPLLGTQKRVCLLKGVNLLCSRFFFPFSFCFFYGFFFFFLE
jgi:hypothetical protein